MGTMDASMVEVAERVPVFAEAQMLARSTANPMELRVRTEAYLKAGHATFTDGPVNFQQEPYLSQHLSSLHICDLQLSGQDVPSVAAWQAELNVRVYQLSSEGAADETEGDVTSCQIWMLPAKEFHGLWDSLVYDVEVKSHLLNYAQSAMHFADRRVDPNIVSWNRVVLLHGPPGTGKTSLCKALAHKLAIRLSDRYRFGQLVEVNAHSLFSKWFSESGKLVNKLFDTIKDLLDDPDVFVCVLIDEVESLTAARKAALSGNEPSDAIRVVNALLTQIDQLKERPNVMVMTTSNITEAIDLAFVDRADIKQYIGNPSPRAIYQILRSCLLELMRVQIIAPAADFLPVNALRSHHTDTTTLSDDASASLFMCSVKANGLSGRALRKIPFLAHAKFLRSKSASLPKYLQALQLAIEAEHAARAGGDGQGRSLGQ
jgi:MoxR-like ATPase